MFISFIFQPLFYFVLFFNFCHYYVVSYFCYLGKTRQDRAEQTQQAEERKGEEDSNNFNNLILYFIQFFIQLFLFFILFFYILFILVFLLFTFYY